MLLQLWLLAKVPGRVSSSMGVQKLLKPGLQQLGIFLNGMAGWRVVFLSFHLNLWWAKSIFPGDPARVFP